MPYAKTATRSAATSATILATIPLTFRLNRSAAKRMIGNTAHKAESARFVNGSTGCIHMKRRKNVRDAPSSPALFVPHNTTGFEPFTAAVDSSV